MNTNLTTGEVEEIAISVPAFILIYASYCRELLGRGEVPVSYDAFKAFSETSNIPQNA